MSTSSASWNTKSKLISRSIITSCSRRSCS
nr:MAG TPA: hypothetical protein [Bacteriophage sp.]